MMYAIVLLSLLAAARSALRCGMFSDLEEGMQMIAPGTNCELPSAAFGLCNPQNDNCAIPTLADGTTFGAQEPISTECASVACIEAPDLACTCPDIPTCTRIVQDGDFQESFIFECVDEADEGAQPTDSTWIFLVSTAGAVALIFICCGALAGYNRRRTTYDRY